MIHFNDVIKSKCVANSWSSKLEVLELEKQNSLYNPLGCQQDIGEIYLYGKDPYEAK